MDRLESGVIASQGTLVLILLRNLSDPFIETGTTEGGLTLLTLLRVKNDFETDGTNEKLVKSAVPASIGTCCVPGTQIQITRQIRLLDVLRLQ